MTQTNEIPTKADLAALKETSALDFEDQQILEKQLTELLSSEQSHLLAARANVIANLYWSATVEKFKNTYSFRHHDVDLYARALFRAMNAHQEDKFVYEAALRVIAGRRTSLLQKRTEISPLSCVGIGKSLHTN